MADPAPYTVSYNFSNFQTSSPTTPLSAVQVDNELAGVATAVAEPGAIKDVRRSDGALKNGVVTFDSLEPGLQLTVDPTNGQRVAAAVATAQILTRKPGSFPFMLRRYGRPQCQRVAWPSLMADGALRASGALNWLQVT
ncbi:hypothetical protein [Bradyrhizobium sp. URHD0069]|uniref:hypothetical protein n=1 Tax=Bradyrhizobium sp. URHD0069 TaxID=1380355 RepID=UPI000497154F|nr:hypothetical protein [Bradyrhizobium sp. URHD0069]